MFDIYMSELWSFMLGSVRPTAGNIIQKQEEELGNLIIDDPEIEAICTYAGEDFTKGTIEITLSKILEIIPRKRRKADAYKGLKSRLLKEYDINLIIKSK